MTMASEPCNDDPPKSDNLISPFLSTRNWLALRSEWMTSFPWMKTTALTACQSRGGSLQMGLEVAITLVSQVDKVIAPADAPGKPFMFAQVTIDAFFNLDSLSAMDVRFVWWNFPDDLVIQLVNDSKLADTDNVLLAWLLDFAAEPTLSSNQYSIGYQYFHSIPRPLYAELGSFR